MESDKATQLAIVQECLDQIVQSNDSDKVTGGLDILHKLV